MNSARFVVFKSTQNQQHYFRLQAANGEPLLASEGYTSKQGCLNGIQSVRSNAPIQERFEKRTAADGRFYFVLKAANGEITGVSETYTTSAGRDAGIRAVQTAAAVAILIDQTNS
jgi:uncharacterized protein YegP (UPF0339 family)